MQVESYGGRGPPRPHAFEQAPQGGIGGIGGGAKWAYSDGREDLGLAEQLEEDSTDVSDFDTSPPPPPPGIGHRRLPSAAAGEAMPPTAMHKRTVQPQATGALSESIDDLMRAAHSDSAPLTQAKAASDAAGAPGRRELQ
eukprot:COSAG06_NODE_5276_length_3591_cov_6.721138_1_plen_139_part_10